MRYFATRGLLLFALLFSAAGLAFGQARTVTGTVVDDDSDLPLPGVNIVVQGTTTGTVTDIDGVYSIQVPGDDAVLVYSFIGYETVMETVGDRDEIDIDLDEDVELLEDVVVVGYGTQRREAVTGSVATIDADDANHGLVTAPAELLQGRVAGVNVIQNSGEPGAATQIRIRGGTSISASNDPLYVIDGVPIDNVAITPGGVGVSSEPTAPRNPLSLLNPNDIQTITVLKDAAATAIYGSRGANGVILIETKSGVAGRVTVDYEGYVTSATPSNSFDLVGGPQYFDVVQNALDEGLIEPTDSDANGVPDQLQSLGLTVGGEQTIFDTDWQEEITRTAVSQYHNLALAGGTSATQYRASVSYLNQEGVIISSGLERITGRLNANHSTFNDRLRFDLNLTTAYLHDDFQPSEETGGFEGGLFTNTLIYNPTFPVYDILNTSDIPEFYETGAGALGVRNPVGLAEQLLDFGKTTRTLGNIGAELDVFEGLTARVNVGADRAQASRRIYWPRESPVGAAFNGRAIQRNKEHTSTTLQTYLTWAPVISSVHGIEILGGYEYNEFMTEEFGAEARDFVTDFWEFNNLGGGAVEIKPYSSKEDSRLVSFFGRGSYNYGEKYYLQGVLRYDGSSRFGAGNKWGLFPAVSAAWRLSEEPFLAGVTALSDLRLRVGYGIVGNQEIGNYRSLALLSPDPGARAVIGGIPVTGVAPTTYANPDLKWEETASFNIGLDYGFSNGRYSGTLEYYLKNTQDLLLEIPVPQPAVVGTRLENIGEIRNQGIEFSLDALAIARPNTSLILGLVFTTNQNELVSLGTRDQIYTGGVSGQGQSGVNALILEPGHPIPTFYGPVFIGFNDAGEQQFKDIAGPPDPVTGEPTGPDGEVDINSYDRTYLGDPYADWTAGFRTTATIGNFDFNLFLRGEFGRQLFNNTALVYQTKSAILQGRGFLADALDDPDAVDEPATFSSRWIENASFLRLDNLTVGYRLPLQNLVSQVRNARIYVSAQNLFVITPYSGIDPEVNTAGAGLAALGIDYTNYPRARSFTFGVNLGF